MLRQNDYLMRYIDKIGDYLLRLANGERDAELDREISDAIGVPLEALEDLPGSFLRAHLETREATATEETIDPLRAMVASELALAVGHVRAAERRPLAAAFLYERAATLMAWARTGDLSLYAARAAEHAEALGKALRGADVTRESRALAMGHAEALGRLTAAEDLLFDLAEDGWAEAEATGVAFYARLERLDDDRLATGGLTRAEVASGLADLRRVVAAVRAAVRG